MPDEPPQEDGIEWLDPQNVNIDNLLSSDGFNKKYPKGPGYKAKQIDNHDESEFKEDVALYAASLMGVLNEYYFTPFQQIHQEELDAEDLALQ